MFAGAFVFVISQQLTAGLVSSYTIALGFSTSPLNCNFLKNAELNQHNRTLLYNGLWMESINQNLKFKKSFKTASRYLGKNGRLWIRPYKPRFQKNQLFQLPQQKLGLFLNSKTGCTGILIALTVLSAGKLTKEANHSFMLCTFSNFFVKENCVSRVNERDLLPQN